MRLGVLIILSIISVASLCGCINSDNSDGDYSFVYSVKINFYNSINFSLKIPIPLWSNGTPSNIILSEIKIIKGNISYFIDDTIYGKAIFINGFGEKIEWKSEGKAEQYPYHTLSLQNKSKGREFWVWFHNDFNESAFIDISCECERRGPSRDTLSNLSGIIINGWNIVEGIESSCVE